MTEKPKPEITPLSQTCVTLEDIGLDLYLSSPWARAAIETSMSRSIFMRLLLKENDLLVEKNIEITNRLPTRVFIADDKKLKQKEKQSDLDETFETGWLIERGPGLTGGTWFSLTRGRITWTDNSDDALRFGREKDAALAITYLGIVDAKPSQHQWGTA